MTDISELIAKMEAATEGSRELDGPIYRSHVEKPDAYWARNDWWPCEVTFCKRFNVPHYTTSLDAKLSWESIVRVECLRDSVGTVYWSAHHQVSEDEVVIGHGNNEILARRIAALKARQ